MSIIDVFINIFATLIHGILSVLPTAGTPVLPSGFTSAFSWVVSSASAWNQVLPLDTAFAVILFIMGFESIYWGFKLGVFIYDKIRGSG